MRTLITALAVTAALAQDYRPQRFFREDWRETPAALPITADHVVNPNLVLSLHGPGKGGIKKSHHDRPSDDPFYVWSGDCKGNWAVSLRHKSDLVDLRGHAKIRWRSKQSGFRELRLIVQLADNTWLVADASDPASTDWREREFNVMDLRWRRLDIAAVVEGNAVDKPDLSRVREIGFTDLMTGGGTPASSRLDWIEVYGARVAAAP